MSPKSRRRKPKASHPRRSGPPVTLAQAVLRSARELLAEDDPVIAALVASSWLGHAWAQQPPGGDDGTGALLDDLLPRVAQRPTPEGAAAVAALALVAPAHADRLRAALAPLRESGFSPGWTDAERPGIAEAWRAVDVWNSEIVLFLRLEGSDIELAALLEPLAGLRVQSFLVTAAGAGREWPTIRPEGSEPATSRQVPVADALAELGRAMLLTDMTWPKPDDEGYADHRALAHALLDGTTAELRDVAPMTDDERTLLLDLFAPETAGVDVPDAVFDRRLVADHCIDFGEGYLPEVDAWSPEAVELFLLDYLPRKVILTPSQLALVPEVTRAWVRYCLERRGVPAEWIAPVLDAVEDYLPDFAEAMDDSSGWGAGKQLLAGLAADGVDITDAEALEAGVGSYNAALLARRLAEGR